MNNIPNELSEKDNTATYDDILNNTEIYEKILTLPDEIAISQYITSLRQVARQYKLTGDFDRLVHPYKEKALKHFNSECHKWFEINTKFKADKLPATYGYPMRKYYGVSARTFKPTSWR